MDIVFPSDSAQTKGGFAAPGGSREARAPGMQVTATAAEPHRERTVWQTEQHALTLYLGVRVGNGALESDALRLLRWRPYTLLYRPPGANFNHDCLHAADLLEVRFDDTVLRQLGADAMAPVLGQVAPQAAPRAMALQQVLYSAAGADPFAVETAALALLTEASATFRQSAGGPGPLRAKGYRRLDATRLNRVLEQVEAALDTPLTLSDLAATAELNVHHFAKAFKATTGATPYQHITARRLSRARRLLETGDNDIVGVALACGFSSQSHLTEQFRRGVGTTPSRYRANATLH